MWGAGAGAARGAQRAASLPACGLCGVLPLPPRRRVGLGWRLDLGEAGDVMGRVRWAGCVPKGADVGRAPTRASPALPPSPRTGYRVTASRPHGAVRAPRRPLAIGEPGRWLGGGGTNGVRRCDAPAHPSAHAIQPHHPFPPFPAASARREEWRAAARRAAGAAHDASARTAVQCAEAVTALLDASRDYFGRLLQTW